MSERGLNPFVKAFMYFARSLKPSKISSVIEKGTHVGTDHLGNQYFEIKSNPSRGERKPTRYYKPFDANEWDNPLPPEWNAWLRMQRVEPPSEEESAQNLSRIAVIREKQTITITAEPEVSFPKTAKFPKYADYEEIPGSKYK